MNLPILEAIIAVFAFFTLVKASRGGVPSGEQKPVRFVQESGRHGHTEILIKPPQV